MNCRLCGNKCGYGGREAERVWSCGCRYYNFRHPPAARCALCDFDYQPLIVCRMCIKAYRIFPDLNQHPAEQVVAFF